MSLCSFASLVHLLHSLSLPHKSQVESETQLQKKCFPGMSPAAEWVFSNGIPNFELFFSWKGTRLGVHSGGQGVDQQGDRQGDKPCKDPGGQWWEDQEGRLGDDDPLLHTRPVGALDKTWPKVRFNVWASGVRAVEPEKLMVSIMLRRILVPDVQVWPVTSGLILDCICRCLQLWSTSTLKSKWGYKVLKSTK